MSQSREMVVVQITPIIVWKSNNIGSYEEDCIKDIVVNSLVIESQFTGHWEITAKKKRAQCGKVNAVVNLAIYSCEGWVNFCSACVWKRSLVLCWYEQIMSTNELADKDPTNASIDLSQHRSHHLRICKTCLMEDPSSLLSLFFLYSLLFHEFESCHQLLPICGHDSIREFVLAPQNICKGAAEWNFTNRLSCAEERRIIQIYLTMTLRTWQSECKSNELPIHVCFFQRVTAGMWTLSQVPR